MLVTVSFINTFTENQYFELCYWGSTTNNRLVATGVSTGPSRPASPSIIMTINKI
jgi:hypothetical protein